MLKYSNIEINKLTGKLYKSHLMCNYDSKPMTIQADWMQLTHYGVPKSDKYHTTDESRLYFQIPLIDNDFKNFITNLDNHFNSDDFRNNYLNVSQQKFNYIPILKEGKNDYPDSMKFKINVLDNKITSEIFHKTEEGLIKECNINNIDDVRKFIPYMSECKLIFKINKIWFMSKNYGVQIKFIKALVKVKDRDNNIIDFID